MNKKWSHLVLSLLLVFVWALAVAGPVFADAPAPDKNAAKFEIKFMQNMIDHHHMAIMMAEMCLEKAVHEELVGMCAEIIATQSQEAEMMHTWLHHWYGITYEPHMKQHMMHKLEMLKGEEFEIEFMQMMIKHHLGAIQEGEKCLDRAYHDELLAMCEDMIATQTQEIQTMQAWLCDWYGICKEYL